MEKYVIKPSMQFYVAYEVTGNQKEEITNEHEKDENGNYYTIIQKIDGLKVTTKTIMSYKLENGKKIKETNTLEETYKKGTKLFYISKKGYKEAEYKMCKVSEAISDLEALKGAIE